MSEQPPSELELERLAATMREVRSSAPAAEKPHRGPRCPWCAAPVSAGARVCVSHSALERAFQQAFTPRRDEL